MNISVRRTFLGLGVLLCMILSSSVSYRYFFVHRWSPARRAEDANWIATSGSWVDRQLCTWFGACGILHLNHANWVTHAVLSGDLLAGNGSSWDTHTFWLDGKEDPEHWSDDERALRNIPDYVLEHAPLVHLYSGEQYWPCDVAEHMHHTKPYFNDMPIGDKATRYNLSNLDTLEEWGRNAFLHSGDNVEAQPSWLTGKSNIPKEPKETVRHSNKKRQPSIARRSLEFDSPGEPLAVTDTSRVFDDLLAGPRDDKIDDIEHEQPANPRLSLDDILPMQRDSVHAQRPLNVDVGQTRLPGQPESQRQGGRSEAPVVMITVNKGNGIVDAFYFYFYSFNLGNKVLNIRFGNHVADWEHSAVRFQHGIPKAMYFSQHASGVAYTWEAVEKIGKRVSHIVFFDSSETKSNSCTSRLHIRLLAPMQCTLLPGYIHTFSHGVSCLIRPIEDHYGTRRSTYARIRMTQKGMCYEVPL